MLRILAFHCVLFLVRGAALAHEPGARTSAVAGARWERVGSPGQLGVADVAVWPGGDSALLVVLDDGSAWRDAADAGGWQQVLVPVEPRLGPASSAEALRMAAESLAEGPVDEEADEAAALPEEGDLWADELDDDREGDQAASVGALRGAVSATRMGTGQPVPAMRPTVSQAGGRWWVGRVDGTWWADATATTWHHLSATPVLAVVARPEGGWLVGTPGGVEHVDVGGVVVSAAEVAEGVRALLRGPDGVWCLGASGRLVPLLGGQTGRGSVAQAAPVRSPLDVVVDALGRRWWLGRQELLLEEEGGTGPAARWSASPGGGLPRAIAQRGEVLWLAASDGLWRLSADAALSAPPSGLDGLPALERAASHRAARLLPPAATGQLARAWGVPQLAVSIVWGGSGGRSSTWGGQLGSDLGGGLSGLLTLSWRPPRQGAALLDATVVRGGPDGARLVQATGAPAGVVSELRRDALLAGQRAARQVRAVWGERARLLTSRSDTLAARVGAALRVQELDAWLDVLTDGAWGTDPERSQDVR